MGLSLRAVAREMGMTAGALYRYVGSRDALITELIVDAITALADALERADAAVRPDRALDRWRAVTRAFRAWARADPTGYALVFGAPVPGYQAPADRTTPELKRAVGVLFSVMMAAIESGAIDPERVPVTSPTARRLYREWARGDGLPLSPAAMAFCHASWSMLNGAVMTEVFGHLPDFLVGRDELFDAQMLLVLRSGLA